MPRRRVLRDVCRGIGSSFSSRNNDIDGWWALGVLCRRHGESGCGFDLFADADEIAATYREQLNRQLSVRGFPEGAAAAARISVEFTAPPDASSELWGFAVNTEIRDDKGQCWTYATGGWCRPHDPTRERRRAPMGRAAGPGATTRLAPQR